MIRKAVIVVLAVLTIYVLPWSLDVLWYGRGLAKSWITVFGFKPILMPDVWIWIPDSVSKDIMMPAWLPVAVFGAYPTWCLISRYRHRRKLGHCACGYDLTGNEGGVCPECGAEIEGL